jgi:hypothetical protein
MVQAVLEVQVKQWAIMVSAVVAGFAVWKYFGQRLSNPAAQNAHNDPGAVVSSIAPRGLYSGVPTFDDTAVANGHGDQVAAAYQSNVMATVTPVSGGVYTPAFGPTENRNDGMEVW